LLTLRALLSLINPHRKIVIYAPLEYKLIKKFACPKSEQINSR